MHPRFKFKGGYTLAELLVAIGVFMIVIVIVVGGFVSSLGTYRRSSAEMSAHNNAAVALSRIGTEISEGKITVPPASCDSSPLQDRLSFENSAGETVIYNLENSRIVRDVGGNPTVLTDSGVSVNYLVFCSGSGLRVTLALEVSPEPQRSGDSSVKLQTTVAGKAWNN